MEKKRVVIAGQVPPPIGGQALMIGRVLDELRRDSRFEVVHLPFFFTKNVQRTRRAGLDKVLEMFAVLWRLARIRAMGKIDALLYPAGGPQLVPLVRDICLLPWILLVSKKVILHFHAGGVAETIEHHPFFLRAIIPFLYGRTDGAIVMTEFGKRDATSLGINRVKVVPNTLEDTYNPNLAIRNASATPTLLYVGHFSHEKGTPSLLGALAAFRRSGVLCTLELVGECLPPYSAEEMESSIGRLGIQDAVHVAGVLSGNEKWSRFARANLFIFPSLAPESFGLVTVEAMMWALPVVACDWRGNREILGESFGGICFLPEPDLTTALTEALRDAFAERENWAEWGKRNRRIFESKYKAEHFPTRFADAIDSLV